jgi:hypothetical protein
LSQVILGFTKFHHAIGFWSAVIGAVLAASIAAVSYMQSKSYYVHGIACLTPDISGLLYSLYSHLER